MDIFAHGLWTAAAAAGAKRKTGARICVGWAAWWGVFPDLFAFTIPVTARLWLSFADPARATAHTGHHGLPLLDVAWGLYQISHSLMVFGAVFGAVWFLRRRPALELLGWLLHILVDIPTHTTRFFPTPFLWPVSSYRFNGISWGNRWFMLANYGALAATYILLWWTGRRLRARETAPPVAAGARRT